MSEALNKAKLIGAVLLGVTIGIAFAPDKGSKTRRRVLRNVLVGEDDDFSKDIEDQLQQFLENFREECKTARIAVELKD